MPWVAAACRRWLVARAGWAVAPEPPERLSIPDWEAVEQLAAGHGVEPLLYAALVCGPAANDDVPDRLRARWERAYYANRIRNEDALALLARLDERCRGAGVEIVSLKGPAAMATLYADIGLRVLADLDVLCRLDDLVRVAREARAIGFSGGAVNPHHVTLEFGGPGGGFLELHFTGYDVMRDREGFIDEAWRRRQRAAIEDWTLPVLSREHQIVFDVAHAAHHRYETDLKHVVDVAGRLMIDRDVIDWPAMDESLRETGLSDGFRRLVCGVEALLGLSLGLPVGRDAASPGPGGVEPLVVDVSEARDQREARHAAAGVRRAPGVGAKVMYAWRRLCPPSQALQAAFAIRTRVGVLAYRPVYAGRELLDVARRVSSRFHPHLI